MYFKYLLVSLLLSTTFFSLAQVITQESAIPTYQLPKLFLSNAGQKITHAGEWERLSYPKRKTQLYHQAI